ncbi:hypothetical protein GIB67_000250 [Kingdonia uniflora]|uniref:Uncharacterized protein n=1 Tax=Kingdonia uniflora TaxID=39325 RepID=A0A7J7LCB5_9MAGN|nr:hypothetical protein GIB67_000250 [Kingdonia uniflora]
MAEEADVPNKKKKVEGPKKEALTDEQFDHVPLIHLKALIPKIPKKGLANRVPRKRWVEFPELQNIQSTAKNLLQQVTPGEILEMVNDLMVDDDAEVGREVNFNAISPEYGGDLLEWKKGDEKDNADKKDVEEKVKSEEEEVQEMEESKNGDEKVDDVAEEEDSEQPTVVVLWWLKVAKIDIVFFNQEKVVGEAYQASADQTTAVSVEEQILEVEKAEDEASQASTGQTTAVFVEEQTIEVAQTEVLVLMESEVDVTLKKRHALTEEEINEKAAKMVCEMNRIHAYLDELLPGVLLESFIQRPISQDDKDQVIDVYIKALI